MGDPQPGNAEHLPLLPDRLISLNKPKKRNYPDLILCNGFPDDLIDRESHFVTYKEPLLLFHNQGSKFENVSAQGGEAFAQKFASRGLATGDFDNDGAVDVLISVNDAAPLLLQNHAAGGNHWLGIKLVGRKCNPAAMGARIRFQAGAFVGRLTKAGGGSFLSASDPRLVLGAG